MSLIEEKRIEVSRAVKVEDRPYHSVVTAVAVVAVVGEEKRMMGEEDPERVCVEK